MCLTTHISFNSLETDQWIAQSWIISFSIRNKKQKSINVSSSRDISFFSIFLFLKESIWLQEMSVVKEAGGRGETENDEQPVGHTPWAKLQSSKNLADSQDDHTEKWLQEGRRRESKR